MKTKYLLLSMGILFIACGRKAEKSTSLGNDGPVPVRVMDIAEEAAQQVIAVSGFFTTDNETLLAFKNGGVIDQVLVKEGDRVKRGQLLASLIPTEVDAGFTQAKLGEEKAARDYARAKQLYKDSVATLEQLQNAETALRIAKEQLRAAHFNKDQNYLRASSEGFILKKLANNGQVVGPGTPILQVNSTSGNNWLLKVGASDKQWAAINIGDKARIKAEALADELEASVFKKSEGVDPASGTFTVYLKLNAAGQSKIASGLFANAVIYPQSTSRSWSVPFDALMDGDGGKAFVFITQDGKTAHKIPVRVKEIQSNRVLIDSGLESTKSIIISGSAYLTDGTSITIKK